MVGEGHSPQSLSSLGRTHVGIGILDLEDHSVGGTVANVVQQQTSDSPAAACGIYRQVLQVHHAGVELGNRESGALLAIAMSSVRPPSRSEAYEVRYALRGGESVQVNTLDFTGVQGMERDRRRGDAGPAFSKMDQQILRLPPMEDRTDCIVITSDDN